MAKLKALSGLTRLILDATLLCAVIVGAVYFLSAEATAHEEAEQPKTTVEFTP